jgi:hypothetical protein
MISLPLPGIIQPVQVAILSFIYVDVFLTDNYIPPMFFSDADDD